MNIGVLLIMFSAGFQSDEKNKICWESTTIYYDSEFKKPVPEDDPDAKKLHQKMEKYEKMMKESARELFAKYGFELVECPKEQTEDEPYHFKLSLAYASGIASVTLYAKVEVFENGKLLFEFKDKLRVGWRTALNREKRKKAILKFVDKLFKTLTDKIKNIRR